MENYIPKEEAKGYIVIDVDTSQVVEATKKTKKLLKLLKKANSLADELASKEILLDVEKTKKKIRKTWKNVDVMFATLISSIDDTKNFNEKLLD